MIKRILSKAWFLLALAAAVAGCSKEEIISTGSSGGNGSSTETGDTGESGESGNPSSGDETQSDTGDDEVSGTTFTRTVTVKFGSSGATVSGYDDAADVIDVQVSGNNVVINNSSAENIIYELTGESSDGSFKLYSTKKQAIKLNGVSLTCTSGAAINNQSGKRTFVILEGTNVLADGESASYSASASEDMKAVFFSEGQLIFSGDGSLTVTANNKQEKGGITSDDYIRFMDGVNVKVTALSSAGHGVRGKDYVQISGGTLNISTAAAKKKGIASDGYVLVEGGTTTINVTGGTAYDSDDAEYKGSAGIKADNYFAMTGGVVSITNSGAGGKGVSAGSYDYYTTNGSIDDSYISGGTLTVRTTGNESNSVSCKGIKIGFKQTSGSGWGASATCKGNFTISGGTVNVNCSKSESIEAKGDLSVSGGDVYAYSTGDDAINCAGAMNITCGYVMGHSTANDALDSNGNMNLSGGVVFGITTRGAPEVALDANTEGGYKLYINSGATVIAYGGLENGYSASQSVYSMSCSAGNWNALHNGSSYIAAFKVPSGISSVAVSAPSLSKGYSGVSVSGTSYSNSSLAKDGISGGTAVTLSTYSGGSGGGPGGGGPGGGGRPW